MRICRHHHTCHYKFFCFSFHQTLHHSSLSPLNDSELQLLNIYFHTQQEVSSHSHPYVFCQGSFHTTNTQQMKEHHLFPLSQSLATSSTLILVHPSVPLILHRVFAPPSKSNCTKQKPYMAVLFAKFI